MNSINLILPAIALIAAAGGAAAWFARSRGNNVISLQKANIDAYKDAERLKEARILYLEGQIVGYQETIKNLNKLIKDAKKD